MNDQAATQRPLQGKISPKQRQQILSACLGTFVEWFDWSLFGLFAIYFSTQFFPAEDRLLSMLGAGITFAIAFVFRPVGGWLLGLLADRRGRRPALIIAMVMMTAGSFLIAATPSFATIGIAAPILLVLARIIQGISAGGDSTNVYIYMAEVAPAGWRNRYSAFTYIFSGGAFLVASLVGLISTSVLDQQAMESFGWRIAFLLGGALGVYGIFARLKLEESEEFAHEAHQEATIERPVNNPLWDTLRNHPKAVALVFGFTMMMTLLYYALTVSFTTYAVDNKGMDAQNVYLVTTLGTAVFVALHYPLGWLADKYGRRPQLIVSAAFLAVGIVPATHLVGGSPVGLFFLFTLCMTVYAGLSSVAPVVYADLFPTTIRGTGLGTWYNIAVALFGGTVSVVLTGFTSIGHADWFFWYVAAAAVVGLISVLSMKFLKQDPTFASIADQTKNRDAAAHHVS